jgi:hypothetical protein
MHPGPAISSEVDALIKAATVFSSDPLKAVHKARQAVIEKPRPRQQALLAELDRRALWTPRSN